MSRIKTFIVGRNPDCDLRLDHSSVSRHHAEIILIPDGRYYVSDRNSLNGSRVYRDSKWQKIRQEFVNATERLRFGKHEVPASVLESLRTLKGRGGAIAEKVSSSAPKAAYGNAYKPPDDGIDPSKGLMRNPLTGEIIEKS